MRKNVASQVICAQLNSKTDGSAVTSGTTDVYVTGDGGTQGAGGGTVAHEGQGCWSYAPTQAETNYNHVAFTFVNTSAVAQTAQAYTVSFDPHDTTRLGLVALPNAAAATSNGLLTSGTGANQITTSSGTVTVGTNNDKTGYTLSASGIQGLWDALTSALSTAGSVGKLLVDNVNATVSSRASQTSLDTLDDFVDTEVAAIKAKTDQLTFTNTNKVDASVLAAGDFAQAAADKVWSSATRSLTSLGAALAEIWDRATSALTTVGSVGKLVVDNVNATISSRASQTSLDTLDDFVDTEVAAIKAKTDALPAAPAAVGDIPTAATIADAVWDEALAGHAAAGSTGEALSAAGAAGDPWSIAIPGAYGAGTAGFIVGTNVDATTSSRASQSSLNTLDDFVDTEVAAIKAKTDALPASPAATGDIPTAAVVADAIWDEARAGHVAAGSFGEGVLLANPVRVRKNTALAAFTFLMVDETDFATPLTGLVVTSERSLDGAAFGSCFASAAEIGNGFYKIDLAASDLNANVVALRFTATGAAQRSIIVVTQP